MNCCVSPVRTVAIAGVTLMVICGGGGLELPHPQINNTTTAKGNDSQRLDMNHPFFVASGDQNG
jgi:hypothetical protein